MPRKFEPGRALWRNLPGTLPSATYVDGADKQPKHQFMQCATLSFHSGLAESLIDSFYPTRMIIQAVGVTYGTQESTIEDIYSDELTLSVAVLRTERQDLAELIDREVRVTEDVAKAVGKLAADLACAGGERGEKAGEGARARAKERFFSMVDDSFRSWLTQVDGVRDLRSVGQHWNCILLEHARVLQQDLVNSASSSAVVGRNTDWGYINVAIAEMNFMKKLSDLVSNLDNEQEGRK